MTDPVWPAPCPADLNLAQYVLAAGRSCPDKVALAVLGPARSERWSHHRLATAVERAAGGLLAAGLAPGDRVLLRMRNSPLFPVAFLGAIWAGIVPVASSAALTEPEITALAGLAAPDAILRDGAVAVPDVAVRLLDRTVLDGAPAPVAHPGADTLAYVVFTSGSSGKARAVGHAHRAAWARRSMWQGWYGLERADRVLHAGAMNWTYTLGAGLLDPWAAGATALVLAEGTDPATLPLLLARHDATILAAVPGLYRRLLRGPMPPMPKLRHGLCAGERLPEATRAAWREATGTELHEALGMSECSTFISGCPDRPAPPGRTGYPQIGRRIGMMDDAGRVRPPFEAEGVLAIHGEDPGLMLGYIDGRGAPDLPLTEGWFMTGDHVRADIDGAISHLGRVDDLMTTGGYRVAPSEIEAVFASLPGMTEVAACPVAVGPDTDIIALAHSGAPQHEAELQARAAANLADFKRPRLYRHLEALPRGANGKLDRRALRRLLSQET